MVVNNMIVDPYTRKEVSIDELVEDINKAWKFIKGMNNQDPAGAQRRRVRDILQCSEEKNWENYVLKNMEVFDWQSTKLAPSEHALRRGERRVYGVRDLTEYAGSWPDRDPGSHQSDLKNLKSEN